MNKQILYCFILSLLICCKAATSQTDDEIKTIKIKKETLFVKAAFDENDYKVIAFDRFGNPHENSVKSFSINYAEGKNVYKAEVTGNVFPAATIKFLTKTKDKATKICLTNIIAINLQGHDEPIPDLCNIVIFPDCKKVKTKK